MMAENPSRGMSSGALWQAGCKDCRAERMSMRSKPRGERRPAEDGEHAFEYSTAWADRMIERGNSRSDRCERHRRAHRQMIRALAVPYVSLQVIGEVPDPEAPSGPLGALGPLPVVHKRTEADVDLANHEFGMTDQDITDILAGLRTKQVAVIEAGTGTGKSTFMPFRLMRPPMGSGPGLSAAGPIIVTEPRLAAAKDVARFVGEELCLGHDSRTCGRHIGPGFSVGFQVRGEKQWDSACELIYVTDGTMVNWLRDGQLARMGAVIVDEVHERSENIDIILAQLRERVQQHKHLRVVITSATLDPNFFIQYFGGSDCVYHLSIPAKKTFGYGVPLFAGLDITEEQITGGLSLDAGDGTSCTFGGWPKAGPPQPGYPVDDLHHITRQLKELRCVEPIDPGEWKAQMPKLVAKQVAAIATGTTWGDILAFLPTTETINIAVDDIETRLNRGAGPPAFDVYPMLSTTDKHIIDKAKAPRERSDRRKIVVSSNLAETSLTVKGVRYIVDSGLICQPEWDPETASGSFPTKLHSQSGVRQRWGRVGRDAPGWVFPLYSLEQFLALPLNTPPGSAQTNLESFYMKLMAAGIDPSSAVLPASFRHESVVSDAESLKVMETFEREGKRARHALDRAGAVDADGHLTAYGRDIERFPGTGSEALALMLAEQLACVHEVALALNVLGQGRLFGRDDCIFGIDATWPSAWRVGAAQRHRALLLGCRDSLDILLRVYRNWRCATNRSAWCSTWWLNETALQLGWTAMTDAVEHLSAAMKGQARRTVDPSLANRARAVLTQAMVTMRYERLEAGQYRAIDSSMSEPQMAELDRAETCDAGPRVLAFQRRRVVNRHDSSSRVFLSHMVQIADWVRVGGPVGSGFSLALQTAQQPSVLGVDVLGQVRGTLPVGAIAEFDLGPAGSGGVRRIVRAAQVVPSERRPHRTVRDRVSDERSSGFDRNWDPSVTAGDIEVPEEEMAARILSAEETEPADYADTVEPDAEPEPGLEEVSPYSADVPLALSARSSWEAFPLDSNARGRIVGYEITGADSATVVIDPLTSDGPPTRENSELEYGQTIDVVVCGAVRDHEQDHVQFARADGRGYLFNVLPRRRKDERRGRPGSPTGLSHFDNGFISRLLPGAKLSATVVPDEPNCRSITLLPALHRELSASSAEWVVADGNRTRFYPAKLIANDRPSSRMTIELDFADDVRGISHRFEMNFLDLQRALHSKPLPGRKLLISLKPETAWMREELKFRPSKDLDAIVENHRDVLTVQNGALVALVSNLPTDLVRRIVGAGRGKRWQQDVWRFYSGNLNLTADSVRPVMLRAVIDCARGIPSLLRVRARDLPQQPGVTVRVDDAGRVEISGFDQSANDLAAAFIESLGQLPRVLARLPENTAGRVIGKGGETRKRLEAGVGMRWLWFDKDIVGLIGDSNAAIDRTLSEIRSLVDSATGQLHVPPGKNGLLIGRQGTTIKRLKDSTGCNAFNPGQGHVWSIEGPNKTAVQSFIQSAIAIVGGTGTVTATNKLEIVEDARVHRPKQPAAPPAPARQAPPTPSRPAQARRETSSKAKPSSGCFIATACYGSSEHADVLVLRAWRDSILLNSDIGRRFVRNYYKYSPTLAALLRKRKVLALVVRFALAPVVWVARVKTQERSRRKA